MKPNFKSRTPQSKPHFDTTTVGSRFITPALHWIALLLASIALLYLNPPSQKSHNHSNQRQNTPSCPSNTPNHILTPPAAPSLSYTPSAPQSCDSTNLLSLAYTSTNSISAIIYTTNFHSSHQVQYIRYTPHAILITTNLTRRPCPCGFCDPSRSIAVPEHINSLGHDLVYSVSTQFLPVIYLPETNSIPSPFDF